MEPLVVMVTFNRLEETRKTLAALRATTRPGEVELVVVDNGSTDGTAELLRDLDDEGMVVHLLGENVGCPRALNLVLEGHRRAGQAVVKVDNDVRMLTGRWVREVQYLVEHRHAQGWSVALVGAYYDGVFRQRGSRKVGMWRGRSLYIAAPIVGHAVWHSGAFMDEVGYFDVLAKDHLYGFEDLLMSHKAVGMGWESLVWEGWKIENLQRQSALGREKQDEHVRRMRPLYNERVAALCQGGPVWTGPDGRPVAKPDDYLGR